MDRTNENVGWGTSPVAEGEGLREKAAATELRSRDRKPHRSLSFSSKVPTASPLLLPRHCTALTRSSWILDALIFRPTSSPKVLDASCRMIQLSPVLRRPREGRPRGRSIIGVSGCPFPSSCRPHRTHSLTTFRLRPSSVAAAAPAGPDGHKKVPVTVYAPRRLRPSLPLQLNSRVLLPSFMHRVRQAVPATLRTVRQKPWPGLMIPCDG